jgi:ABC-type transport system involved in Fe-S cluster assembly fused permease/ATPase subunit
MIAVQYVFNSHLDSTRYFINSLQKIEFDKTNDNESKLAERWDLALNKHKNQKNYIVSLDSLTVTGFLIVIVLVFIHLLMPFYGPSNFNIGVIIYIVAIVLFIWLIISFIVVSKAYMNIKSIKIEFKEITKQHNILKQYKE